ncbi:LytTR family DNA-binding domain-containing protein [uncultured Roseobacter sp.]|uniref:LytTR family DNA-binding domain-containing protein n=1 Tax=uncultured Roseobacter sp. TaxID=114847 RepID=UPI00260B2171|nr:LytTR family DNA-binding domain-containing protein [uncultured Roseobacter sp.]
MPKTSPRRDATTDMLSGALLTIFGSHDSSWQQLAKYCLGFSVVGGLVITSFDPLVTAALPLWLAALHWVFHLLVAACLLAGTTAAGVLLGARMPWPLILAVCVLPFLLTPFSLLAELLLDSEPVAHDATSGLWRLYAAELASLAPPSLGLSTLMAVFAYRAAGIAERYRRILRSRHLPEPPLRSVLPSAPHRLGDDILHAEAQDHYVTITTTQGTATLKLAFADCVTALKDFHGAQCHRSHWVRFKHVQRIKPVGSAYVCTLYDGAKIPVSRRRYRDLKRKL